ncbi:MAG: hypothetical protein ABSE85_18460 [Candidatus Korobacteraceae bacterium]
MALNIEQGNHCRVDPVRSTGGLSIAINGLGENVLADALENGRKEAGGDDIRNARDFEAGIVQFAAQLGSGVAAAMAPYFIFFAPQQRISGDGKT